MGYLNVTMQPMSSSLPFRKICVRSLLLLAALTLLSACSSAPKAKPAAFKVPNQSAAPLDRYDGNEGLVSNLMQAEEEAEEIGRKILATGRVMTLDNREIVRGSCWDYTNAVYTRSGYPNDRKSRVVVFKGTKSKGPYADARLIKPGDWLYYVNHSYNGVEHSAIFVKWVDFESRSALMLSYGGEKRNEPARYLTYDLSNVYQIIRPSADAG